MTQVRIFLMKERSWDEGECEHLSAFSYILSSAPVCGLLSLLLDPGVKDVSERRHYLHREAYAVGEINKEADGKALCITPEVSMRTVAGTLRGLARLYAEREARLLRPKWEHDRTEIGIPRGEILVSVQKTEGQQNFPLFPEGEQKQALNTHLLNE